MIKFPRLIKYKILASHLACFFIICLTTQQKTFAQAEKVIDTISAVTKEGYTNINFYSWGMLSFGYKESYVLCEQRLREKYGFSYTIVAGCAVKPGEKRRWIRHNKKCEKQMIKRHGINWRSAYESEFNECLTKEEAKE